jgi:hypothetical protein
MGLTENSLDFRKRARTLTLGWFRPSILEAEQLRAQLNKSVQEHWKDPSFKLHELIHEDWEPPADEKSKNGSESENFIVGIDPEFDVDWINDGDTSEEQGECISQAEAIGARRCRHLPPDQILELKRLIGQAVVNAITGNPKLSRSLTQQAAQFLRERTIERSRVWTLASAHSLLLCAGFTATFCQTRPILQDMLGGVPIGLWLAAAGGLLGAYLSVVQKAGSGEWDAASGLPIHILEVFTKLAAGTFFGGIAFVLSNSVHAPAAIKALTPDNASFFMFGIAAGIGERLIPKMISTYSEAFTKEEPKKSNDKKSNTH